MSKIVSYELIDQIGLITVNNPPVNALSHALRQGLQEAVNAAQNDASKALVLLCAGRTFIAGADITEFGKPPQAPSLPDVLTTLENSAKPIIAAIHGTALGGGSKPPWPAITAVRWRARKSGCPRSSWASCRGRAVRSACRDLPG